MKTCIKNIKTDLYHVFVAGNAKSQEIARVWVLVAIPVMFAIFVIGHFPL